MRTRKASLFYTALLLAFSVTLFSCESTRQPQGSSQAAEAGTDVSEQAPASSTEESPSPEQAGQPSAPEEEASDKTPEESEAMAAENGSAKTDLRVQDPYAGESEDAVPDKYAVRRENTDYGTVEEDVRYYSATAGDDKFCNVLLPPGYDETQTYPVLYMIHGWGGAYDSHVHEDSRLQTIYGNLLEDGLTVPMIIVGADMYTDLLADKDSKSEEEMRLCYDGVVDDIAIDLIPFINENYPVKADRLHTAVMGVSQGASEALAAGFKWQSLFGYIGSFAPDSGVIPTEYYAGTYWNWPILEDLVIESPETMPRFIYLSVGTEDPWNIEVTAYYGQVMDEKGIPNRNDLVPGYGHDGEFWGLCYYNFLQRIF